VTKSLNADSVRSMSPSITRSLSFSFLISFLLFSSFGLAQVTTLGAENFDGGGIGFIPTIQFNDGSNDHFSVTNGGNIANVSGPYSFEDGINMFFAAEDTDDNGGNGNAEQRIEFTPVAVAGFENITICMDFAAGNNNGLGASAYDAADYVQLQYNTDLQPLYTDITNLAYFDNGDNFNEPLHHDIDRNGDGSDGPQIITTSQTICAVVPMVNITGAATMGTRLIVSMNGGNEEVAFEEYGVHFKANVIKGHKTGYFCGSMVQYSPNITTS